MALVEAVQIGAEVAGLAALAVAGFLASVIAGLVVFGLVLLVVGKVRWGETRMPFLQQRGRVGHPGGSAADRRGLQIGRAHV